MEAYKPRNANELVELKAKSSASLEGICTGCAYCDDCPQEIPIPKFMDAYNQMLLAKSPSPSNITNRLNWHWGLNPKKAGDCISCGQCEKACTQHINIIKRLGEISRL
jgi:predicted aldo/keto reductase-like oxidoreductase